jgi:putative membrane protein insertion efficiency factor
MESSLPGRLARGAIRLYQVSLSPLLPSRCRFSPSCSHYAHEAFAKYPFAKALGKSIWRLLRCHPFSRGGVDQP